MPERSGERTLWKRGPQLMDFLAHSRNSTISMWKERAKKGCSLCGRMRHLKPRSAASSAILRNRFHVETPALQRTRNVTKAKVVLAAAVSAASSVILRSRFHVETPAFQRVRNVIKGKAVLAANTRSSMSYEVHGDFRRPSDVFALQFRFAVGKAAVTSRATC